MFRLIKKVFIALLSFSGSLSSMVDVSNHTKYISLNNQPCMVRTILTDFNPDEWNQRLHYYPFMVNLDSCNGSCNTLDVTSGRVCVPNKTEEISLNVFDMITRINESKTLPKHISCKCKCKFDSRKFDTNWNWNKDKYRCKNPTKTLCVQTHYIWYICENGKYLESIIADSLITCDEIIEVTKTVPTKTVLARTVPTKTIPTKTTPPKTTPTNFNWFTNYVWWNYRGDENCSNKTVPTKTTSTRIFPTKTTPTYFNGKNDNL